MCQNGTIKMQDKRYTSNICQFTCVIFTCNSTGAREQIQNTSFKKVDIFNEK